MKKVILILAILSLSCSKDDSTEQPIEPINDGWTFYYRDSCDIYQASGSICLSEDEYMDAMENPIFVNQTCFKIKIDNVWYTWFGAVNVCN